MRTVDYKIVQRLLFALLIAIVHSAAGKSQPDGLRFEKSTSGYTIDFSLPEFDLEDREVNGEQYQLLTVDEYGVTSQVGKPQLPRVSFNLIIPDEKSIPEITIGQTIRKEHVLSHKLYPAQQPWPKSKPISERPFSIDADYYASAGTKSAPLYSVSKPFVIAGVTGITVTISPFQYDPVNNKLTYIQQMDLNINLPQANVTKSINSSAAFHDYLGNIFANSTDFSFIKNEESENYLIITDPRFADSLSRFIDYRLKRYQVDMFTTEHTGTTTTSIKGFIQARYDNATTRPAFILLVGDVDHIPNWTSSNSGNPPNDLYYGTLEGEDYFQDAYVGRFSVSTNQELANIVHKTIHTDSLFDGFDKKAVFLASRDNYRISEGTHNFVIDNYMGPGGYDCTKRYCVTTNATSSQVIDDLNSNQTFAVFSGHGDVTYWADGPSLYQNDVRALFNAVYPLVYSFSCLTGRYTASECFGETWIRTSHGAASFWGSSISSYWGEDDVLEKKLFEAVYVDSVALNGPSFHMGKMGVYNHYSGGGLTHSYFEQYNLFGDPALALFKLWSEGVDLAYHSSVTADQSGDGIINPGENVDLIISLQNSGSQDALDVSATLISSDVYVSVTDESALFGNIASHGGITGALDNFSISIDASCPTPYEAVLQLNITDNAGGTWLSEVPIYIFNSNTVRGHVLRQTDSIPVANATVSYSGPRSGAVTTDSSGFYSFTTIDGTYAVSASATNFFQSESVELTVPPSISGCNFFLTRPDITVTPVSITESIIAGNTKTRNLLLTNGGHEPLEISLSVGENMKQAVPADEFYDESHFLPLHKDSIDRRVGLPAVKGQGGPDTFGYRWVDSDEPGGPSYTWQDIKNSGEQLSLGDDDFQMKGLSFPFPYYENTYNSIFICSNGFISLESGSRVYSNTAIPHSSLPNGIIAGFWDDLNPNENIYFEDFGDKAIIQYDDIRHYGSSDTYTFQIVMERSGMIYFYYQSMTSRLNGATVGIENMTGSDGLNIVYNNNYVHSEMAVCISTAPRWIYADPLSATIPPLSTGSIEVTLDAGGLSPGAYSATININHNDPASVSPIDIPVTLTVIGESGIFMQPLLTGVSALPASRASGIIVENLTAGSAAGGEAVGQRFHLFLR